MCEECWAREGKQEGNQIGIIRAFRREFDADSAAADAPAKQLRFAVANAAVRDDVFPEFHALARWLAGGSSFHHANPRRSEHFTQAAITEHEGVTGARPFLPRAQRHSGRSPSPAKGLKECETI